MRILGYRVKDCTDRALIPILKNDYDRVLRLIKDYDAVEDTPWYMIYRELDKLIPNSKFILTVRDEEEWYQSVKRHIGDLRSANHEWIYGRGKGLPKEDKENTIAVYQKHNEEVKAYFKNRPDDLLVLDFTKGDQWEKLCAFLNREIPDAPFPHANNSKKAKPEKSELSKKWRFYRKQMKSNFKMKYLDVMGYW